MDMDIGASDDVIRETLDEVLENVTVTVLHQKEDLMEYRDQVRETLQDVLPGRKIANVTDTQILSVLKNHFKPENTEMDADYDFKYFPLKIVDLTVQ